MGAAAGVGALYGAGVGAEYAAGVGAFIAAGVGADMCAPGVGASYPLEPHPELVAG